MQWSFIWTLNNSWYLPSILRRENYIRFKSIHRMRRVLYFVFHFVKNLPVFFSDAARSYRAAVKAGCQTNKTVESVLYRTIKPFYAVSRPVWIVGLWLNAAFYRAPDKYFVREGQRKKRIKKRITSFVWTRLFLNWMRQLPILPRQR